jgi:RNA polymerase sporulation-specific sigma factor
MSNEELALLAAGGDEASMHALYIAVAPLVLNFTRKYFPFCAGTITDPEDLIQCGYFAVWEAARAFDPARGCRFTTTLQYHVQNVCWEQLGFRRKQLETVSLSTPIDNDEDLTIEDMIEDPKANIYDYIELNEMQKVLREAVNSLPALQKYIIYRYYFGEATIEQIASELRRSKNTVSSMLKKAYYELSCQQPVWDIWEAYSEEELTEFSSPLDYAIAMEAIAAKREKIVQVTTNQSGLEMI